MRHRLPASFALELRFAVRGGRATAVMGRNQMRIPPMALLAPTAVVIGSILVAMALAAQEVDDAVVEAGRELFAAQCAVCHQPTGLGSPPVIPALAGNANLADVALILGTVHRGRGAMPAHLHFGAEDLRAVVTYIRNAWENDFGPVQVEEVGAILDQAGGPVDLGSVWDGVFTEAQASRGMALNERHCAECHGATLTGGQFGGPPLAGRFFMHRWSGLPLQALFEFARINMPPTRPGSLTEGQYLDLVAYILQANSFPAGGDALALEHLSTIIIESEPGD